ncbi:MAG: hypothetical protein ACXABO_10600 [Promethearchaeota archaeon]
MTSNYENSSFFLTFIQEKEEKQWETYKEGLTLRLDINEICDISDLFEKNRGNKQIIHAYKGEKKNFWFGFERKKEDIVFSIKGRISGIDRQKYNRSHQKSFYKGELRLLRKLWFHIEKEFIKYTTKGKTDGE